MKQQPDVLQQRTKPAAKSIPPPQVTAPRRYPIWSTKVALLISLAVFVTIALLVFVVSDRSIFVETQITLFLISLCLFAFLTTGLYRGVRLERPDKDELARTVEQFDSRDQRIAPRGWDVLNFLFAFSPPDLSHFKLP